MSRIEIGFLRDGFEVFTSVLKLIGMILSGTGQQFPLGSERWSFLVKTHVGQVPSGEIRIVKFILQSLGVRCRRERRTAKIIEDGKALRVTRAVNNG